MDIHGNQPGGTINEIRIQCSDCGHAYLIRAGQKSSQCKACGNIEFHAESSSPLQELSHEILHRNVLPLLGPRRGLLPASPEGAPEESRLDAFRATPDGNKVQDLLIRYQVEWQLWAAVVKDFGDPVLHTAYLSQVISDRAFDQATRRYQEHRNVMALSRDSKWQAEIADLMLERVQALSVMRMEQLGRGWRLPLWIATLPIHSRSWRIGLFLLGMFLMARLFRVF